MLINFLFDFKVLTKVFSVIFYNIMLDPDICYEITAASASDIQHIILYPELYCEIRAVISIKLLGNLNLNIIYAQSS